jgi:hypothetical protein
MDDFEKYVQAFENSPFQGLGTGEWDERVTMPEWMLDKLIPAGSIGMLFGPNNSGKSHLVCDLVVSMRNGHRQWQGHDLSSGPVVSFSESHGHIKARLKAYINHLGGRKVFPLYTHPTMSIEPSQIEFLAAWLRMLPQRPMMVIFDTLSTSFQLEENDNREAAKLMKLLEHHVLPAIDPLGCVLIVHHTSKVSEGRSARGASALVDNIDFSINVQWDKDIERTVAKWEKDRWRLIDQAPQWAGEPHKVPVEFTNGETEMMVLEWSEHSDEAKELAKELQKDMQMNEWKAAIKAQLTNLPAYVHYPKHRVPDGHVPFVFPKEIPSQQIPTLREWMEAEMEVKPAFSKRGKKCGFFVVVTTKSPK